MNGPEQLYSALEFDRVLEKMVGYAASEPGRESLRTIRPFQQREMLLARLQEISQMMAILQYDDPYPIHGIQDIRAALTQAAVEGGMLPVENLINVAKTLQVSRSLYRYLGGRQSKYPALVPYFHKLRSFSDLIRAIEHAIDFSIKEIKDNASPELLQIRKSLRRESERVRNRLAELVEHYREYLQEPIITLREGRMVLPLREDCKGQMKGFIHDRSASGATLFIEPMEVLEMNNQIRELQIEERREIERLLQELTAAIREQLGDIQTSFHALIELDVLHAIARFGVEWGGSIPKFDPEKLSILRGYHPLLVMKYGDRDKVVPLDVCLEKQTRLLVITGPNAGGKTVALKTIGLSALMFQCGLPVLADERSQFPLFDQIFVDIGDLQSLEQDLSTFSAHVARLAEVLHAATEHSLVLIDEIGTGTDPAEGSALAMAFLQELHRRDTLTVVTTHQGSLKAFAHKLEGAENASMAFDDQTLQPTYHFRVGIPGSSYAFEIARRLGLPARMVSRARKLIGSAHDKLEKFILELEQKLNRYQQLLATAEIKKSELEGLTRLYRRRYEALQKEEKKLKRKAAEESKAILQRANRVIEEAVKEIRTNRAAKQSIKNARAKVESVKKEVEAQLVEFTETETRPGKLPGNGDMAVWEEMNVTGRVVSEPDTAGNVWLEAGDLKLHLPLKNLRLVKKSDLPQKRSMIRTSLRPSKDLRTEIDLRGMTMDEAKPVLEKYLDQAYLAGLDQVRIIHGKGTGALRKKVNEYLKAHPRVDTTNYAAWNEGDIGVTIVRFKE